MLCCRTLHCIDVLLLVHNASNEGSQCRTAPVQGNLCDNTGEGDANFHVLAANFTYKLAGHNYCRNCCLLTIS
jgi:hypothetical protein